MAQIPVPNAYRVAVRLTRGDEQIVNVMHVRQSADNEAEQDAVMGLFQQMYGNQSSAPAGTRGIRDLFDDDVLVDTITIQDLDVTPFPDPREISVGLSGTRAADPLPLATTINVQLRTALGSRNGRGRIFLGGFTTNSIDESVSTSNPIVVPADLTAIGNAVNDLLEGLSAQGTPLVVASLYDGVDDDGKPIPRAAGVINNVTSARITNKFGVQRRRQNRQTATSSVVVTP